MRCKQKSMIFLTVGNEEQRKLAEKLIADLYGVDCKDITVISDSGSGRVHIGSGGALLDIVDKYYSSGDKFLIINSGGLSKRSVNYCIRGKVFADILLGGSQFSLLEQIIRNAKTILKKAISGILVCCSDILVDTGEFSMSGKENVGFAVRGDCATGERHGVFFCRDGRVWKYVHKKSRTDFEKIDPDCGSTGVLLDTGMVFFKDQTVMALKNACNERKWLDTLRKAEIELNLYPEIITLLSVDKNISEYIYGSPLSKELTSIRRDLIKVLNGFNMSIFVVKNEKFHHFGTTQESLYNILALSNTKDNFVTINSHTKDGTIVSSGTVLDNVSLSNCKIGKDCFISDILLEDVSVGDNLTVCGLKQRDGSFVTVVCSIKENPKELSFGVELWKYPRFYKGQSFNDSYTRFMNNADEKCYSLEYCIENADYGYYFDLRKYLLDMGEYTVNAKYLAFRKRIIENLKATFKAVQEIRCLYNRVEVFLPARVNFSGTWTDAMPYCIENGGEVVNMAVTVDKELPIRVAVERCFNADGIEFCCEGKSTVFRFGENIGDDFSDYALHKSALLSVGVSSNTRILDGFRISTFVVGLDKGSGLGVSSILLSGCIKAMCLMFGLEYTDSQILSAVFAAEQIMGTGGGWQDQAGGFLPGIKSSSSNPGIEQILQIEQINFNDNFRRFIAERFFLVPTGKRHYGRFIVNDVVNRYLEKNPDSLRGHMEIRSLNKEIIDSIKNSNFSKFSNCINRHFELLKLISPMVSDPDIDLLASKLLKIADSVCALGAGGGGYLLVVAKENISCGDIELFMKDEFPYIKNAIRQINVFDSKLQIRCE